MINKERAGTISLALHKHILCIYKLKHTDNIPHQNDSFNSDLQLFMIPYSLYGDVHNCIELQNYYIHDKCSRTYQDNVLRMTDAAMYLCRHNVIDGKKNVLKKLQKHYTLL